MAMPEYHERHEIVHPVTVVDVRVEPMEAEALPSSETSDYDNLNGLEDYSDTGTLRPSTSRHKAESYTTSVNSDSEMVVINGHDEISSNMRASRTEESVHQNQVSDMSEQHKVEHQNGVRVEKKYSHQVSQSSTTTTRTTITKSHKETVFL